LFSIILGLSISRLLTGVVPIVQHAKQYQVYWVHLLWAWFVFPYLIDFWRWEYRLAAIQRWTSALYFFIAIYAVLLLLLRVLRFPDEMADYDGFKAYYYSRRQWIFGLMTLVFVADIGDTLLKGWGYLRASGPPYYTRTILSILLCAVAIKIKDERFHAAFAIFATAFEIALIVRSHMTMG
jgi:hypothetical protein